MKVTTDACLFGAWVSEKVKSQKSKIKNILDIGAGTGLLSLMFAQKNPDVAIDAIEIDADAYQQAKENIAASPFTDHIELFHDDARKFSFKEKYDLIISNPPFYEKELKSGQVSKNLAHHGDELSLTELFSVTGNNLAANGIFYFLLPYKRHLEIRNLLEKTGLSLTALNFIRQSTMHDYFRIIAQGNSVNAHRGEIDMNEISIWDDQQQYTKEFIELLKDYYLYL